MVKCIEEVLALFQPSIQEEAVNFAVFAMLWLDILTTRLKTARAKIKSRRYLSLENLGKQYKQAFFTEKELNYIVQNVVLTERLDLKIAACIIG